MGSVLILNPENLVLANRLAFEGHAVRVYQHAVQVKNGDDTNEVRKSNPRRVSSLKLLDQYDFAIICRESNSGDVARVGEECTVLGASALNQRLMEPKYLQGVVESLMDARILTSIPNEVFHPLTVITWFDRREFIYIGYLLCYIRMCDGERGPITEGTGWVLWKAGLADHIVESFIGLKKLLSDLAYAGPITINYLVTDNNLFVTGIRVCFCAEMVLWHEIAPKGLYTLFTSLGMDREPVQVLQDYAIGVMCQTLGAEEPNYEIPEGAKKHFYDGLATARGQSIEEGRKRVYRTLRTVTAQDPEIFYRNDIGFQVEETIGVLKMWGWLHA